MDADIKALENEVAKINPPPHHTNYAPSRGPSQKQSIQYHPYNPPPKPPQSSTAAIIHQQIAARSAIAQAQVQAARLQAQAAAINAARTRTLMSAAAQAQAARVAAHNSKSVISSGPKTNIRKENVISSKDEIDTVNTVGPSYVKNTVNSSYNKYKLSTYRGTNYKRYDYDYKKTTNTIPNSSLRNHLHDIDISTNGKVKKKKLKATHQYQLRTAANEKWVDPTMTDWPENDFRIFCGDLGNEVSDAMLTSAFSKYPSFAKAKVVRDKRTGKSKGYGFVSFLEPHDFIRAFKEMNGKYVGNRPIKLRRSKWKERMKKVKNFKIRE
eukprot:455893_1